MHLRADVDFSKWIKIEDRNDWTILIAVSVFAIVAFCLMLVSK